MSTIDRDPALRRQATWRVAAADPRNEWRVTAAVAGEQLTRADELAWRLSLTVRAQLGNAAIEATATEEPGTWSVPPGAVSDGWRAQSPVARRIVPTPTSPVGEAGGVTEPEGDAPSEAPGPEAVVPMPFPPPDNEHGDRTLFLALARQRLAGGIPLNMVHPPPPRPTDTVRAAAAEPVYMNLDRDDILGTFTRAVEEAGGVCHHVVGDVPDVLLDRLVAELDAWDVVVSHDPEAVELGERLADRGVEVHSAERDATAGAALGVTSAVAAIAATGSVVLDSSRSGGRLSSVLPPAHLCVLPVDRLVATPADVLRGLGDETLPSSLVLVTGPSRTGDIEQLLTIGAHGPTTLHVVVVSPQPEEHGN